MSSTDAASRHQIPDEMIHLVQDGPRDPAWNMALDDALLHLRQEGALAGTWVRLFGWAPAAVSIGRLQSPHSELDLAALRLAAVPVVRRSTGGKAVFHANELTYSLVGGVPDSTWGANLHDTYRRVSTLIMAALSRLGVETAFAPRRSERAAIAPRQEPLTAACFAVAFGHELVHGGRKICGSAQRRLTRAFLQHGSLLLGPEQADLARFLRIDGDREGLRRRLLRETIDVTTAAGRVVPGEEIAQALANVFHERFPGHVVMAGEMPPEVIAEAGRRREEVLVDLDAEPARLER